MARSRLVRALTDDEKDVRREEILDAAKRVFAERGFHATTVADVARNARVSYGSVYFYFGSKEALFHALMEREEQVLRDHAMGAIAALPKPRDVIGALRAVVRATFEFCDADRAAVKLLFRDVFALGGGYERHMLGIYDRFVRDLEGLVADAQRRGAFVAGPPAMVAYAVAALVSQFASRRLVTDDELPAVDVADFVVDLVLEGLRPR